ncbi:MAG: hypothetical protein H8K11_02255 [Nitrospira sp.]|nr:hypothetical protein [Nitrospira sp.]
MLRLAVSARLAIKTDQLTLSPKAAAEALLTGYLEGLQSSGQPFVLAEQHSWLRDLADRGPGCPVRRFLSATPWNLDRTAALSLLLTNRSHHPAEETG